MVGWIVHLRSQGVEVKMPLQAYFRINAENMGQFERTLIIADEGAKIHYIEGCTAAKFSTSSLHSAVVELIRTARRRVDVRLYHDPKLVSQHFQSRYQTRRRSQEPTVEWVTATSARA